MHYATDGTYFNIQDKKKILAGEAKNFVRSSQAKTLSAKRRMMGNQGTTAYKYKSLWKNSKLKYEQTIFNQEIPYKLFYRFVKSVYYPWGYRYRSRPP